MRDIYLLSGLGADKSAFNFIDLSGFNANHIEWVNPVENEQIENYAKRLSKQIQTDNPIVIGVSFGGIMAVEIAKQIKTEKIILISSVKTKHEIPLSFRFVGYLKIHRIIPIKFFKQVNRLTYWLFGAKTKNEKELLMTIIKRTDTNFLRWAIDKIVNWKNTTQFPNLFHIHGTDDKILPLRAADYKICNGGHLMIVNKGAELTALIRKILG
jgi:esterase/lipase